MVDANSLAHQLGKNSTKGRGKPEIANLLANPLLFLLRQQLQTGQCLGLFSCLALGEKDDVDWGFSGFQQLRQRVMNWRVDIVEIQRHRARRTCNEVDVESRPFLQVGFELRGVSESGGHQQELATGKLEQGHLPCPPAIGIRIEVEFIHYHLVNIGVGPVAQSDIGDNFRSCADDGCTTVDGGIAGHHTDILSAKDLAEGKELLADQGLNRRCVKAALATSEGAEVGSNSHHGLARPCRSGKDDVVATSETNSGLLLGRVERDALIPGPGNERVHNRIVEKGLWNLS